MEKKCNNCGKNFFTNYDKQKYCSKKCGQQVRKKERDIINGGGTVTGKENIFPYLRLRFEVFKRDNFTCQYCGRNVKEDKVKLHIEHIIPKAKGGKNASDNLTTSCWECNSGKAEILLTERNI
jgi:hypothetical protein